MVIDHLGIIVKSIEHGIKQWTEIFQYTQMTEIIVNTRQKVKVVFLKKEASLTIKLIEPIDNSSPIYNALVKGIGLHHIGFKCKNIDDEIVRLKKLGLRVITKPEPGEAFGNNPIAFLFVRNNLNIELIDTDFKAGIL